jgi:hypothetical protein
MKDLVRLVMGLLAGIDHRQPKWQAGHRRTMPEISR